MSTAQNPLTGKMSGSMGNFITTVHKGKNIIKSKAFNRKDANTEAQQAQRSCFKLVVDEYNSLGGIVDIGYAECDLSVTPFNAFLKECQKAIDKTAEKLAIDYTKMKVSQGSLKQPPIDKIELTATGLSVSYFNQLRIPKIKSTDHIYLLVKTLEGELYFEEQVRGTDPKGSISVEMEGVTADQISYAYLFVVNGEGTKASDSLYLNIG